MKTSRLFQAQEPPLPNEGWLTLYMQQLGYHTEKSHICFGAIHAAATLVMAGGIEGLMKSAKWVHAAAKVRKPVPLTRDPDFFNHTLAFLDTTELFSVPDVYSAGALGLDHALMQQQGLWFAMPFMLPVKLDKQSKRPGKRVKPTKLIKTACTLSGAYPLTKLKKYFNKLGDHIRTPELDPSHPVTMVLGNTKHSIMVVYENNQWILVNEAAWKLDDESSLVRFFDSDEKIAEAVYHAFGSTDLTIFTNKVYATHQAFPAMKAMFDTFLKDQMHAIAYKMTPNEFGTSLLHVAALYGDSEAFYAVLSKGANPNQLDAREQTALHIAANAGDVEMAQALLDNGADINIKNALGYTALIIASWSGRADMVDFLLKNGADERCVSYAHKTAYDYAKDYENVLALLTKPDNTPCHLINLFRLCQRRPL